MSPRMSRNLASLGHTDGASTDGDRHAGEQPAPAQPAPHHIRRLAREGIRTVVNLRGERLCGSFWLEQQACARHGIALVNFSVRSRAAPSHKELRGARELFERIEYPMLMHCKSGADRAGLAIDRAEAVRVQQELAVVTERERIARELHDTVIQRLGGRHYRFVDGRVEANPIEMRYVWPAELDLMARIAGMRLQDRWANWQREPFTALSPSHVSVYERL